MSFGVPSDAGMEGPQRCRHDGAQRREILIMGPSAAGMTGPQRRGGAPAVAGTLSARVWRAAACAGMARLRGECGLSRCMGPNRASKHTSKPCQQAYKQTVPASIQADRASKHTS